MNTTITKINPDLTKEQMIHYYLFVDEQLLCAWWDYLDYWNSIKENTPTEETELRAKMDETMEAVDYWEGILDQLKKKITYAEIEEYVLANPQIKKNFLFMRS